ncbi:MAG: hypothetical protein IPJ71_13405 [Bdellovibrionales bacterium]|nr:hypothetical protein [Bdellovibrionales bacterium]
MMSQIFSFFYFYRRFLCFISATFLIYFYFCYLFRIHFHHASTHKLIYNQNQIENQELPFYENLILGDSTATLSLFPKIIPDSLNLSQLAGGTTEANILLRRYLNRHVKPKRILMSFSFNEGFRTLHFWTTYVRSGFYSLSELFQVLNESKRFDSFPGSQISPLLAFFKFLQHRLYLDQTWISSMRSTFFKRKRPSDEDSYEINRGTERLLENSGGSLGVQYFNLPDMNEYSYLQGEFAPSQDYLHSLEQILDLCKELKIVVHLSMSPYLETFNTPTGYPFFNGLKSYLESIKNRYPQHIISTEIKFFPKSKMAGGHHTNNAGGTELSQAITNEIYAKTPKEGAF